MQRASRETVRAMMPESIQLYREKFTSRLEAISDLVLGFSLSPLATRLDVPAKVEDIYDADAGCRSLARSVSFVAFG
jgi:hypothetical protein